MFWKLTVEKAWDIIREDEIYISVHKDNPERLELLKKRAIEGSEKSIEYFGSFKKGGEKYAVENGNQAGREPGRLAEPVRLLCPAAE